MTTIELIKKLSELGRLVEAYKEKTSAQAVWIFPAGGSKESYWELFRAEVRKVAGELMVLDKHCDPKFYTLDFNKNILKLSFDELFKRLLGDINTSLHASQLLITICHKMGVELERKGA